MENKSINPFENKTLKGVRFIFENCESFYVPAEGIERLWVSDIHYSFNVHINGLNEYTKLGEMCGWARTDYVAIILNEKGMNIESDWKEMEEFSSYLKERIKHNDITHFDFIFTDNTNLYVSVPWEDGENEYENRFQYNTIKDKMIFIDISKDINKDELEKANEEFYKYEIDEETTCIQCGKPTKDKKLDSGVWACKECLHALGKEQNKIREEIEDILFGFGFDNYTDICDIIDVFEDIINFIDKNSNIDNLKNLITCLDASKIVMQLQHGLLTKEKEAEILKKYKEFASNL